MTARRMHQALESDPDPEAVLARFVDRMPATDEELRRQPLGNLPGGAVSGHAAAAVVLDSSEGGHKFAGKIVMAALAAN
ncbi:hypothetical protein ACFWP5_33095 [Streptomyces sp. NPDC058469]|uniref:hypothetical protein n=1 Tax=Streptomyces sp. NPDC058469 TaxID=3346514 RepID=UPI003646FEAB